MIIAYRFGGIFKAIGQYGLSAQYSSHINHDLDWFQAVEIIGGIAVKHFDALVKFFHGFSHGLSIAFVMPNDFCLELVQNWVSCWTLWTLLFCPMSQIGNGHASKVDSEKRIMQNADMSFWRDRIRSLTPPGGIWPNPVPWQWLESWRHKNSPEVQLLAVNPDSIGLPVKYTPQRYMLFENDMKAPGPTYLQNVTAGLVNWWKFDEGAGTTAADSADSATGSAGDVFPTWTTGAPGFDPPNALSFNGTDQALLLATNTGAGANAFSVTGWINVTASFTGQILFDGVPLSNQGFALYTGGTVGNSKINITIFRATADMIVTGNTDILNTGWRFITAIWDGNLAHTPQLFIDATESAYQAQVVGSGDHVANASSNRYIGRELAGNYFTGSIDDLRVYNRAITHAEMLDIFAWRGPISRTTFSNSNVAPNTSILIRP